MKVFSILLALVGVPCLFGRTYYVATDGTDSNSGTIARPFATLARAATSLRPGDTLYVRGGTYHQKVFFFNSGVPGRPITISGYPKETAVIDGEYTLPEGTWGVLVWLGGEYISIRDLTIQQSNWIGLKLEGSFNEAINIKSYRNNESGILVTGPFSLVENCDVFYNAKRNEFGRSKEWDTGLSAARNGVHHVTLRGNRVWNNWGEGLSTYESTYITLEGNTVWDNWATNVYLSDTQHSIFRGNLVYRTQDNPVSGYGGPEIGIEMGDEKYNPPSSDNTVINNLVVGARKNFYWWQGRRGGGLVNTLIANNTFVNSSWERCIQINDGTHQVTRIENNIIEQDDSLETAYLGRRAAGLTYRANLWSKEPPKIGRSPADIIGDPLLVRGGAIVPGQLSGDWFRLSRASPAIGKGERIPEVTVDFFGAPRRDPPDIGACEVQGDGAAPLAQRGRLGGTRNRPKSELR